MASEKQVVMQGKAATEEQKMQRRTLLKVLGSGGVVGAVGCSTPDQNILQNVKGSPELIPGVATWYSSTCTECTAGCGVRIRTREGRAVKVEGNPDHPTNRGGLCALGQASLQALYDPDRVRQPLARGSDGTFAPISWSAAYQQIATALASQKKKVFLTGETSGALDELLNDWSKSFGVERASYDLLQPVAWAKASALTYGEEGLPHLAFDKAEVIVSFGADFLETWVSPVQFARDWAKAKRAEKPVRFVHVEPRLSLTGANADLWLAANPGTEVLLARMLLKLLMERGFSEGLDDATRTALKASVQDLSLEEVSKSTGVDASRILVVAEFLATAKSSLLVAGGASAATQEGLGLQVAVNLLNIILGNIGKTVFLGAMRRVRSSVSKVQSIVQAMRKGEVGLVFMHGTNLVHALPPSFEVAYGLKQAQLVVSFASHLDESAKLAHLVLPASHSIESWGDVRAVPGVYGLTQPAMRTVFDTKSLGDMLLGIADTAGKKAALGGHDGFESYLKASWQKLHQSVGAAGDFKSFWLQSLERGGYFASANLEEKKKPKVSRDALSVGVAVASFAADGAGMDGLTVMPYFSVTTFDGRSANRPWLQELPDPITKVIWDSWAEIHPTTAHEAGLKQGDVVTIRNHFGEINVAAYITEYVRPGMVAVPIGQGHTAYGRYAQGVGANVLQLLPANVAADGLALFSARAEVVRGRGTTKLLDTQGSLTQRDRDLARTSFIPVGAVGGHGHQAEHAGEHAAGGHHEAPKQMYQQREHPLYSWGMAVDLAACTGCSACVVACYAENNIPVVGKEVATKGREMSWLRIERYYDGPAEELTVNFLPMMCQQCGNAPCEPVCPVYATYHNEEGLNAMVYNRCVGTRYCSNNCTYKVRRFNWWQYEFPEPLNWQLNPDVTPRNMGVMEKCTFCIQRINEAKDVAKDLGRPVQDGEVQPACVQSCPTEALVFGNLNDPKSRISHMVHSERAYKVLDHHLNTQPAVTYLNDIKYKV